MRQSDQHSTATTTRILSSPRTGSQKQAHRIRKLPGPRLDDPKLSQLIEPLRGENLEGMPGIDHLAERFQYHELVLCEDGLILILRGAPLRIECASASKTFPTTPGVTGLCLDVHDLAISKYVAGREKDREFTRELAKHGMVRRDRLIALERDTTLPPELRKLVKARMARDFKG
jgi:hypothetical protein